MPKIDERIEALEAKLKQLKVQHQRKEARARFARPDQYECARCPRATRTLGVVVRSLCAA
jgi:hypothetical protein